ncbi:MAG: ABC transporter ATP-binding protein [Myxococcota bacterium]
MASDPAHVSIEGVSFAYDVTAPVLVDVRFDLDGGVFGLLGPNGAGKTTLMKLVCGLLTPGAGEIRIGGERMQPGSVALRRRVSMMPQDFGLFAGRSVQGCLDAMGALHGYARGESEARAQRWVTALDVGHLLRRRSDQLSGGERQKVGLAMAMMSTPDVLLVDEPTAGLDPLERDRVLRVLHAYGRDASVLLSTHIVEDVLEVCPAAAMLIEGRIADVGTTEALAARLDGRLWTRSLDGLDEADDGRVVLRAGRPQQWRVAPQRPGDAWTPSVATLRSTFVHLIDESRRRDVDASEPS